MSSSTIENRVGDLRVRIQSLSEELESLSSHQSELKSRLFREMLRLRFFQTKIQTHQIADRLPVGRWFILLCVPLFLAAVSLIFTDVVLGLRLVSFFAGALAWTSSISALAVLLNGSDKLQLQSKLQQCQESHSQMLSQEENITKRQRMLRQQIGESESELAAALHELRAVQLSNSFEKIRGDLYRQNWKAMRDVEFEQFLEKVFQALGYIVETTAITGDQGVDLIVAKDGVRVAIQVKGYHSSVGNGAIQEAFAGMAHYQCHACAAITNSRFTNSAVSLAKSTNCFLIDEESFRDFVMGRSDLIQSVPR